MKTENTSLQVRTAAEFPKVISARIVRWQRDCATAAADQVALVNSARAIGLLLREWTGHEQLSLNFFETHKRSLPPLATWNMLRSFIAIAGKIPEPVINLCDAKRALQTVFETGGFLQISERRTQSPSEMTPYMNFANRVGGLRANLFEWLQSSPLEDWDAEQRAAVKELLKPLVEDFYAKL